MYDDDLVFFKKDNIEFELKIQICATVRFKNGTECF